MGINGTLDEAKKFTFILEYVSSTSVPFRSTMMQMPNLALVGTKQITERQQKYTDKFSSYIRKFRVAQLQSHI
jgi:hypothetical protein